MVNMDNFLWDKSLSRFFTTPPKPLTNYAESSLLQKGLYNSKNITHTAGNNINKVTYNAAQALGKKMLASKEAAEAAMKAGTKVGIAGKLISKSKNLTALSEGLSKLGTTAGSKMSGVGTLFGLGFAVSGIYKAGKALLKGNFKEAGHEALTSAGKVAGCMASMAMFVPGVGFLAGLAIAIGVDTAITWSTEKIADTLFPSVAAEKRMKEHIAQLKEASRATSEKMAQQNINPVGVWRNQRLGMYG